MLRPNGTIHFEQNFKIKKNPVEKTECIFANQMAFKKKVLAKMFSSSHFGCTASLYRFCSYGIQRYVPTLNVSTHNFTLLLSLGVQQKKVALTVARLFSNMKKVDAPFQENNRKINLNTVCIFSLPSHHHTTSVMD